MVRGRREKQSAGDGTEVMEGPGRDATLVLPLSVSHIPNPFIRCFLYWCLPLLPLLSSHSSSSLPTISLLPPTGRGDQRQEADEEKVGKKQSVEAQTQTEKILDCSEPVRPEGKQKDQAVEA